MAPLALLRHRSKSHRLPVCSVALWAAPTRGERAARAFFAPRWTKRNGERRPGQGMYECCAAARRVGKAAKGRVGSGPRDYEMAVDAKVCCSFMCSGCPSCMADGIRLDDEFERYVIRETGKS